MTDTQLKSIVRFVVLRHHMQIDDSELVGYEWTTSTTHRVLLKSPDGTEIDIEYDMVLNTYRVWINGETINDPEWN